MAYPNEIIVGENIYNNIDSDKKEHFLGLLVFMMFSINGTLL